MPNTLNLIDTIALLLYTIYFGGMVGGAWLLWKSTGKQRLWSLVLLLEFAAAAIVLTLMSSKYWIGRSAIINIGIRPILEMSATILIPIGMGLAVVIGTGYLITRATSGRYPALAILVLCLLIPGIFSISTLQLISLTEQEQPVAPVQASELKVQPGFTITQFLKEPATNPTSLAFGPDDILYMANYNGDIWAISLEDNSSWLYASGFNVPVGLAWHAGALYVASHSKVSVVHDNDGDQIADDVQDIVKELPARLYPWHANNGIIFGPDGRLYFGVGSTSNNSTETRQYAASVLSVNADGSDLRVFATGVRNPYRLAFNSNGDLFGTDNGPDGLDVTPGDELNHIVEGGHYGFPDDFALPRPGSDSLAPVAIFPPHASADGLIFYEADQFPTEYLDNAFVTLWHLGDIYRVELTPTTDGRYLSRLSTFVTGLNAPLDMAVGPDGSLYVTDFNTSVIYKITYEGGG